MTQTGEPSTESLGFAAVAPKCPLFPKVVPVANGIQLYPFATRAFRESIVTQAAARAQAEIERRASSGRAHNKRGPPAFPSRG
jgi:hypothetical protein